MSRRCVQLYVILEYIICNIMLFGCRISSSEPFLPLTAAGYTAGRVLYPSLMIERPLL